jgi:hypothetical protein
MVNETISTFQKFIDNTSNRSLVMHVLYNCSKSFTFISELDEDEEFNSMNYQYIPYDSKSKFYNFGNNKLNTLFASSLEISKVIILRPLSKLVKEISSTIIDKLVKLRMESLNGTAGKRQQDSLYKLLGAIRYSLLSSFHDSRYFSMMIAIFLLIIEQALFNDEYSNLKFLNAVYNTAQKVYSKITENQWVIAIDLFTKFLPDTVKGFKK